MALLAAIHCSLALALSAPTFTHDIAPIVFRSCAPCHHTGGAGPFPLLTYEDVRKHAGQIADVTRSRFMPPWLPEQGYGDFEDERRLTTGEIQTIQDWVAHGAPEGASADLPAPPSFPEGWQLGKPDLVVTAAQPFAVPAAGPDRFWNFVLSPKIDTRRYVRAVEIRVDNPRLLHHANLVIDRMGALSIRSDGFPGMELALERSTFDLDGNFLFWKPGSLPYSEPDGFSWVLNPGNNLVMNAHIQPSGKEEKLQPSVGLYFTDKPPAHFPLLIQLEHDGALDIPAGSKDFLISDDFRLPLAVDALAIYPHAHYLGKLLEAYATLPDGSRRWLIRIPDWNLNWQAIYRYRKPVYLPAGSVISMRYHYDNSAANPRNPNRLPKRVRAGNEASDEMGHLWLQLLPRGVGDRRRELAEAWMRHRVEKYPNDFSANLQLGALQLSRLNAAGAASALAIAVRVKPEDAIAHNLYGSALQTLGRSREALEQFQAAVRLKGDFVNARYNLARSLIKAGRLDEAIENLRVVVAAYPNDRAAREYLARALALREKK
ncbi:MAG TPA: tetratricopeptide repeat protein [Bryobacteraceae bacterium]|jgi:tetratricopeptide (TPR) repeat protein